MTVLHGTTIVDLNVDIEIELCHRLDEVAQELHAALQVPAECKERISRALELLDGLQAML